MQTSLLGDKTALKQSQKRIRQLEKELTRKVKALAEQERAVERGRSTRPQQNAAAAEDSGC